MKKTITLCFFFLSFFKLMSQDAFVFQEENGLVIIEAESTTGYGSWHPDTVISGYLGNNYLLYNGPDYFNSPGNSVLTYHIHVDKVGTYRFQWRSRIAKGTSNTDHNDSWLRIPDASKFYAQKSSDTLYPHGSGMSPNPDGAGANGWFKIYQNALSGWTWNTSTNDHDPYSIFAEFDSTGIYTIEISGRSNGHAIDRIVLYHSDISSANALDLNMPESPNSLVSSVDRMLITLNLFPNPTDRLLEISVPQSLKNSKCAITIMDVSGRIVKQIDQEIFTENSGRIPIDGIPSGNYFIMVRAERIIFKGQFTKL
jgi:hypothetical protein